MNKIKTIFSVLITFVLTFGFTTLISTKASNDVVYSENGKGSWKVTEETNENIYGMNYTHVYGETSASGAVNNQQVNLFEMKTDGTYSKLVNWAYQNSNNTYKRATLMEIAKNYEETHPGWIVLGGINADQYAMTKSYGGSSTPFYPQPFYPLVMDGERRFVTGLFGTKTNFVGFNNNNSEDSFTYESECIGYYVYIYNENGDEVSKTKIEGINQNASNSGTTVWMPYQNADGTEYICDTVQGNLYVVENPELQYVSNAPLYGVEYSGFGKGNISKTENVHTLKEAEFLIQTNDTTLQAQLSIGTKVIVQGAYANEELNTIESTAGFHSAQRLNDKDVEATASYDTQTYSRSIFGRKADGTYALVTVDLYNGQYKGMTQDESNAMLKSYGIVEAYQQDGGGSVTACVRNSIGSFDLVNKPKDGSTRTIFNGLFFVVRDPGFRVKNVSNTRTSIFVSKEETLNSNLIRNAKATVNGKTYELNETKTEIAGLIEDTIYDVTFTFEMYNEKSENYEPCSYTVQTKTKAFKIPESGFRVSVVDKNSITLVKTSNPSAEISNVMLTIGNFEYNIGNVDEYTIDGLIEDTAYIGSITYDVYDPESGNIYKGTENLEFTTLKKALPQIVRFEILRVTKTRITIGYEYTDRDDVVSEAYLYYNKEKIELTSKSGTISVNDLDLDNVEYTLYIQIAYDDGISPTLKKIKSEKLIQGKDTENRSIAYELDGGILPEDAADIYIVGTGLDKLPIPTKEGYIFKGWLLDGELCEAISKTENRDITLVATWEKEPTGDNNNSGSKGCNMGTSIRTILSLTTSLGIIVIMLRKKK